MSIRHEVDADRQQELQALRRQILTCSQCDLCRTRRHAVPGEGPVAASIMFVGEAPGHVNDAEGRPFVGRGGAIFDGILSAVGISRQAVFISNAVKCWPPDNRKPKPAELRACANYLRLEVALVRPKLIVALGATAFEALTGNKIAMKSEHGRIGVSQSIPVCAIFHPNGLRYVKGGRATLIAALHGALMRFGLLPGEKSDDPNLGRLSNY